MTISKQPGRPPVHRSRAAGDPSKRKINRRSFFAQVVGGAIAGGGLVLMTDRAIAQVTDNDPYPPAGDPVGGGRGAPPSGVSDTDPTDPAGRGRGAPPSGVSDRDPTDPAGRPRDGSQQASPPRSGPAQEDPNSALGQAQDAGTGRRSVNEVMQGGNAGAEVRASGDVVVAPSPSQPARALTPAEVSSYNRISGFPEANAQVDSARRAVEQAEAREAELIRESARAADTQTRERLQTQQREAAQAAQAARSAERVAEIRRDDVVRRAGAPIIRRQPQ